MEHFNTNLFAVYGLHFNPGIFPFVYTFNVRSPEPEGAGHYDPDTGEIHLIPGAPADKLAVPHELGHAVQAKNTSNVLIYEDSLPADPTCGVEPYLMNKIDYVTEAFGEAFAHFYAAATYNNMEETNCWYPSFSCERGSFIPPVANYPNPYMKKICTPPQDYNDFSGLGVDIDWLRALWHIRTAPPSHPSTNDILNWFDTAAPFTKDNAYEVLDDAANNIIQGTLMERRNEAKDNSENGLDGSLL